MRWLRRSMLLVLSAFLVTTTVPRVVLDREASAYADGDRDTQLGLARAVAAHIEREVSDDDFHTGSALIDAEWALATHQMAILGLGQVVLAHPETRGELLPAMQHAADILVSRATLDLGRRAWGVHPLDDLGSRTHGHAYLGYVALSLGMLRAIDPETPHAALHDRMVRGLAARLDASRTGVIETYPGQTFPPDVATCAAAIGMHALVTGTDRSALLARFEARWREHWIGEAGYLVQRTDRARRHAADDPRGSGTAFAAYFLTFATPDLARDFQRATAGPGAASFLGFGAVREYPPGIEGWGDVDSGPVVLGVGVTATGFGIGAARAAGDHEAFLALTRTALLFGAPASVPGGARPFVAGGAVGDAIMLAMLTALPPDELTARVRALHRGAPS